MDARLRAARRWVCELLALVIQGHDREGMNGIDLQQHRQPPHCIVLPLSSTSDPTKPTP
jgi:hypothetical protein